jgi:head-tail adaptor
VSEFRVRRHRIVIQKKIDHRNCVGEVLYDWQDVCTTWSEIRGNVISIRYQSALDLGMRVVIGNSFFEIVGIVDRQGKTRLVELHVQEFKETGRRRFCPAGVDDEQQGRGLSSTRGERGQIRKIDL